MLERIRLSLGGSLIGCMLAGACAASHALQYEAAIIGFLVAFWSLS